MTEYACREPALNRLNLPSPPEEIASGESDKMKIHTSAPTAVTVEETIRLIFSLLWYVLFMTLGLFFMFDV